jgi:hypothetical protein
MVVEQFEGKVAWRGTVEVFDLVGHPKARRAYAWTYRDGDQNKTIPVLGIPPVDSPQSAVKVAMRQEEGRPNKSTKEKSYERQEKENQKTDQNPRPQAIKRC